MKTKDQNSTKTFKIIGYWKDVSKRLQSKSHELISESTIPKESKEKVPLKRIKPQMYINR